MDTYELLIPGRPDKRAASGRKSLSGTLEFGLRLRTVPAMCQPLSVGAVAIHQGLPGICTAFDNADRIDVEPLTSAGQGFSHLLRRREPRFLVGRSYGVRPSGKQIAFKEIFDLPGKLASQSRQDCSISGRSG